MSLTKITKLTPEQGAEIPNFIAKWVKQASAPTDRKKATQAVKDMYQKMGEDEPVVIFGQSPLSTAYMAAMFLELTKKGAFKKEKLDGQLRGQLYDQLDGQLYDQLRDQLYDQLDGQLYDQLRDQLRGQLRDQLYDQLRDQLYDQLYDQLRGPLDDQLYGQLDDQLYGQLDGQLRGQLDDQLYDQLRDQLRGQLDDQLRDLNCDWYMSVWWLAWAGWYDYGQFIGVKFDKKTYDLFVAFVSNVGFIIPYRNIAFVSEAPAQIHWNDNRQLHNESGKSVEYADGWGVYTLHGVRFDKNLELWEKITSGELTAQELAEIEDVDQRRIAMTYLKGEDFIKQMGAKLVNEGKEERVFDNGKDLIKVKYRLYKVKAGEIYETDKYFLTYLNPSTGEEHMKFVTRWVKELGEDADAIIAATFHTTKEQFFAGWSA